MTTSWRIARHEYRETSFDGRGARLFGGRWNSPGAAMVYTSSSAALAALELLVHIKRRSRMRNLVLFACTFEDNLIQRIDLKTMPEDWASNPAPAALRIVGDRWVTDASSVVLQVPSAIIPSEFNYLLNPAHPDFVKVSIADPVPFSLDLRLLRR